MRAVIAEDLALLRDGLIRLLNAHDVEVVVRIASVTAANRASACSGSTFASIRWNVPSS